MAGLDQRPSPLPTFACIAAGSGVGILFFWAALSALVPALLCLCWSGVAAALGLCCCSARTIFVVVRDNLRIRKLPPLEFEHGLKIEDAARWAAKGPCRVPDKFRGLYWLDGNIVNGELSPMQLMDITYAEWDAPTRTLRMDLRHPGHWVSLDWSKRLRRGKETTPTPQEILREVSNTRIGYDVTWDAEIRKGVMEQWLACFNTPRAWHYQDMVDTGGDGRVLRRRSYFPVLPYCAGPEYAGPAGVLKRVLMVVIGLIFGNDMCPLPRLQEPADFGSTPADENPALYEYYSARRLVDHEGNVDAEHLEMFMRTYDPSRRDLASLHKAHKDVEWAGTLSRIAVKKVD